MNKELLMIILLSWNAIGIVFIIGWVAYKGNRGKKVLMVGDVVLVCVFLPVFISLIIFMLCEALFKKIGSKILDIISQEIK